MTTFIDLFAGIGGIRMAFENVGCTCVYSNEWDKFCRYTYVNNYGVMPDNDIKQVDVNTIPNHDILAAGFPCQPFSLAGIPIKKLLGRATGFDDQHQGTLFFDICRVLNAKRPKAFLLENVKHLLTHNSHKTFSNILQTLNELHYKVFYEVMDAQDFVPQHRERLLIVGFDTLRYGENISFDFNVVAPQTKPTLKDILEENVDDKYTLSDKLWNYLQLHAAKHKMAGHGFGYSLASPESVSRTLTARYYKDGSEILIEQAGKNPRKLTPRECARLQGFPDTFNIVCSDTQAYKQFGNSVAVPLVQAVAKKIIEKIQILDGVE